MYYVRMYVCMYYVCIMYVCKRMYVCFYVCMYACVCMYYVWCMYAYVCTYVCMFVCMYLCTYVCMFVCLYVRIYVCIVCFSQYIATISLNNNKDNNRSVFNKDAIPPVPVAGKSRCQMLARISPAAVGSSKPTDSYGTLDWWTCQNTYCIIKCM
jgi:hypothetical protein